MFLDFQGNESEMEYFWRSIRKMLQFMEAQPKHHGDKKDVCSLIDT